MTQPTVLQGDILMGASQIAEFLGVDRSRIYHLVRTSGFPFFRLGAVICARKSTLLAWILSQERKNLGHAK